MTRIFTSLLFVLALNVNVFCQIENATIKLEKYQYPEFFCIENFNTPSEILVYNSVKNLNTVSIEIFKPHLKNFNNSTFYVKKIIGKNTTNPSITEYFKLKKNKWIMIKNNQGEIESKIFRITDSITSRDTVTIFNTETYQEEKLIIHEYQKIK